MVGGEAGSGKSRLVREFAMRPRRRLARPLRRCDSVVRRPYRPFVEALEQLVRASDAATLQEAVGTGAVGGELFLRLMPDPRPARHPGSRQPARTPIPTPSAIVCTARSPICSSAAGAEPPW